MNEAYGNLAPILDFLADYLQEDVVFTPEGDHVQVDNRGIMGGPFYVYNLQEAKDLLA